MSTLCAQIAGPCQKMSGKEGGSAREIIGSLPSKLYTRSDTRASKYHRRLQHHRNREIPAEGDNCGDPNREFQYRTRPMPMPETGRAWFTMPSRSPVRYGFTEACFIGRLLFFGFADDFCFVSPKPALSVVIFCNVIMFFLC